MHEYTVTGLSVPIIFGTFNDQNDAINEALKQVHEFKMQGLIQIVETSTGCNVEVNGVKQFNVARVRPLTRDC